MPTAAARLGLAALLLSGSARMAAADVVSWTVGGQSRQAIVYAPAETGAAIRHPLVMAFHGFGDEMENFQHVGLHQVWPDAVVVYFQGLPTRDRYRGWQVERGQYDDRDLALVDTALASLRRTYRIDAARIYATGFSNGAMFTYLLWAERPAVFAAYAPVAGRLRFAVPPTTKRPLLHVAGKADTTVPFADQQTAFETAIRVNGVAGPGQRCGDGCVQYGAGSAAPVMVVIHDGGHTIPLGIPERIVAFFRQFPARH